MSSRPGALPFFSTLMPMSSSSAVNALVNPGSSGYRCRSRRTFGCLCDLVRSGVAVLLWLAWVVTKLAYRGPRLPAVVSHVCHSIRVCHALRCSSEMALIISSPSVMVLSAKGSSSYVSRYSSDGLGCQAWDIVPSTPSRNVLSGDFTNWS